MSSHQPTVEVDVGRSETPLGATLRGRWRALLATFLTVTFLAFVGDWYVGIDARTVEAVAGASRETVLPIGRPFSELAIRFERASLVGLCGVAVATPLVATRDREDVRLRRGGTALLLALGAGAVGAVTGDTVGVDAVRAVVASGLVDDTATGGRFWLAELAISVPAMGAVAFALPGTVVGAVRSRLVGSSPTTRQRWLSVLALLTFVAVYSPSDAVTFVLGATAVLGGLVGGLALVESDVIQAASRRSG